MIISERYTKGLGNAALYATSYFGARYWNFVTLAWVTLESVDTKRFLTEYPDARDAAQSAYETTITPPTGGEFPLAIVQASDGTTLFKGTTESISELIAKNPSSMINQVIDDCVYNLNGLLTASVIYVYDSPGNARIHNRVTGLIGRYNVSAAYTGKLANLFKVVETI